MNKALYPDNWKQIATEVKTEADWCCEGCGKQCYRPGQRHEDTRKTFLKDLAVHCDGLAELPDHDEQGVIDFEARKNQRKQAAEDAEASSA